jgi:hypothetical protein
MYLRFFVFLGLALCANASVYAQSERIDFSEHYERIYQIRTVSNDTGTKSSIGSGFQVSANGLIITNYHVVSDYIATPDSLSIKYVDQGGLTGDLELLDFDVVSDIALLKHPHPADEYFTLSEAVPSRGEIAYALGNPGDWGIVLVPGPTNGYVEHSYEKTVLFSGSLNSGMSGGPALNRSGDVIGVNVANAGSQLSFLVPVHKVKMIIANNRQLDKADYYNEIANQITTWQRPRLQGLIDMPWKSESFFDREYFGEIRHDFQCWNSSNSDKTERTINKTHKSCEAGDSVYLSDSLTTGEIEYSFSHRTSKKLNSMQFALWHTVGMSADNSSDFESSTNYICESDYLKTPKSERTSYTRIVSCIRAYKKLQGLFDSQMMILNHRDSEVVKSYFSIAGAQKDQIMALKRKFVEALQ